MGVRFKEKYSGTKLVCHFSQCVRLKQPTCQTKSLVLWIRKYLVWNRMLLFRSFRILPFKPGQLNNWFFLNVHNGTAARLFLASLRFSKGKNVKDKMDHLKKNLLKKPKTIQIFLSKKSDPDPLQLFRIRIPPSRKVPDTTGYGSTTLKKKHQLCREGFIFLPCNN